MSVYVIDAEECSTSIMRDMESSWNSSRKVRCASPHTVSWGVAGTARNDVTR